MLLYSYFRSSTSYRARIALGLKGLSYDYANVDLRAGAQSGDTFSAINPHQTVPALVIGESTLAQSLAIIDWLEINHPEPSFVPSDPEAAQTCRELYYAIATELHAPLNLYALKYLRAEFGADETVIKTWYQDFVHRTFKPVEERLASFEWAADGLPFETPGLFDIVLIPQVYNSERWEVDLSPFPLIQKIDQHCAGLPAFEQAHPDNQPDSPEYTS